MSIHTFELGAFASVLYLLVSMSFPVYAQQQKESMPSNHPIAVTLQTGFADTFQLTLGGTFGGGPAWQNRITMSAGNIFRKADAVVVSGFSTLDIAGHHTDWLGLLGYRSRIWMRGDQRLETSFTFERWRFPSVLRGSQDWLAGYGSTYASRPLRIPITVQTNGWTLLHSPLRKGSLLHTQVWAGHPLLHSDRFSLTLRHGPQHTYSWNFYGTQGNRVVRYAGALVLAHGKTSLELGYRQQIGLQPRIPDNRFWSIMLTQSF